MFRERVNQGLRKQEEHSEEKKTDKLTRILVTARGGGIPQNTALTMGNSFRKGQKSVMPGEGEAWGGGADGKKPGTGNGGGHRIQKRRKKTSKTSREKKTFG